MRLFRWHPALSGALVAAAIVAACETVPYTGRSQLQFMSPQQETQLGVQAFQQMLVNVGLEATMAALSSGNPATVQAVASLLGAGAKVGLVLPWGRAQESEADHLGLILMAKAGYDPHAARDLWVRMTAASQGSGRPPEFLSTHPSEPTRVRQLEAWMPGAMQYYRPR